MSLIPAGPEERALVGRMRWSRKGRQGYAAGAGSVVAQVADSVAGAVGR
jgi:hypothetical protein